MPFIDLHMHSTCSDGSLPPGELVRAAARAGVVALSLTDHDTLAGWPDASAAAAAAGIEAVPGVEISTLSDLGPLHVLGYLFDPGSPVLAACLTKVRSARGDRNARLLERLGAAGVTLSAEEVAVHARDGVVGRPHIAAAMVARRIVSTVQEAFDRYLGPQGVAFTVNDSVTPAEAAAALHAAGGLAVLAHPGHFGRRDEADQLRVLERLVADGIDGLEAYHPSHDAGDESRIERFARRFGLLVTGGSDFHAHPRPEAALGKGRGTGRVPVEVLARMKARLAEAARRG